MMMRIALAQINPLVGDLRGNCEKILRCIKEAKEKEIDLIAFPELCITGYPPKDLLNKEQFLRDNKTILKEIALHTHGIYAIIGFVDYDDPKENGEKRVVYNSAALLHDQKIIGVQHKTLLPTYDVFNEQRYFTSAKNHEVFLVGKTKIGIEICEDLWDLHYNTKVTDILAKKGAEVIINISSSPYRVRVGANRLRLLKEKASKHKVPFLYVNQVSGQDDLVFDGESLAVDETGALIAIGKKFKQDLLIVDLNSCCEINFPDYSEISEMHDALVLGLREYIEKNGFDGVVIGLSGGIDSAVTCALAVEAIGKDKLLGVSMPSEYSSEHSKEDAEKLAKNLGIQYTCIPIQKLFDSYKLELKDSFKGYSEDGTEENLQARIRGTILMALSNKFRYLLLATGNKSELAVGYCTLYGDMCGGFCVLSDVYKTKVYELAAYINRQKELIPKNSITKPPSAELRPNQLDQDSLPPYELLDALLKAYIEEDKSKDEIAELHPDIKIVEDIIYKVNRAEFKRKQAAPGIKLTEKAFGTGRQMPIVNRYAG